MATYVNDLRLKEIATGDESGTWGTSTNTNLELIGEALGYGTEGITTNADTHATTVADGTTDPGRAMYIKYTGTLDSTCTITIGPNTDCRVHFIENATSGSQSIIISQGSGANVTIPNGHVKAVYLDGAGSGAAVTEAFTDLSVSGNLLIDGATPTITLGDAGAEDTKIVFDGNAQDFYIGLDDSADDLIIGLGSTVGTTPIISVDENKDVAIPDGTLTITVDDNSNVLTLKSTDADENSGPRLALTRDSGSPADDDYIGLISFNADDDGGNLTRFGYMVGQITDASNGSEDGLLDFYTTVNGTETKTLTLNSGKAAIPNGAMAIGQSTFSGGSVLLDLHASGSGVGAQTAYYNDHNTGGVFVGLAGNTSGDVLVYNVANTDIDFYTNNAFAATITAGGDFGAGIAAPLLRMTSVDSGTGGVSTSGNVGVTHGNANILIGGHNENNSATYSGIALETRTSGASRWLIANEWTGTYLGDLAFHRRTGGSASAEAMRITSGGNVGIGTASPTSNAGWNRFLEIAGGSSNAVVLDGTDGQEAGIGAVDSLYIDCYGHSTATNNNIIFRTQSSNDSYSGTEQMRINSLGQVLIGATAGTYTHDNGLRVYTGEVGSNYLDAALSLQGSGGDFYAQNWVGSANVGFGLLAVFSGTTDYLIYSYRASSSNTNILQLYQNGDVQVHGAFSKASGSFRITHPLPAKKDTHDLVHSFIEGPQADLIYRGAVDLVGGSATVNLDTAGRMTEGTFVLLNTNTQCFTSNESGWTAIKGSVSGNILTITAQDNTCTDTISWMVVGERHDQHMKDTDWTDSDGRVITEPLQQDLSNETT